MAALAGAQLRVGVNFLQHIAQDPLSFKSRGHVKLISSSARPAHRVQHICQASYSSAPADNPIDVSASVKNEKILVLGGNGFVGTAVCREALKEGIEVVSLNRSGPPSYTEPWVEEVKWERGDVFTAEWSRLLAGVDAVVSCIGGFGSNEQMERINGDANIAAVDAFVYVSVHEYNLPSFVLGTGYFNGKRRAEAQLLAKFPSTGVVLRPGFIYGKRRVSSVDVPLDAVGQPLEKLLAAAEGVTKFLKPLPASDLLLAPPVSVEDIAASAIKAVLDDQVFGVYTIQQIKELAATPAL
eukprot:jgi/Mesen1/1965/ME000147S01067